MYYSGLKGGSRFLRRGLSSLSVLLLLSGGLTTFGSNMTVLQTFGTLVGETLRTFSLALAGIIIGTKLDTLIVVCEVALLILL